MVVGFGEPDLLHARAAIREPGTIWEIGALGGTPQRLLSALGPGDVSHDGRSIAFLRVRDGNVELAVASRNASQTRAFAKLPAGLYDQPRWSPDDRRIAFSYKVPGPEFYDRLPSRLPMRQSTPLVSEGCSGVCCRYCEYI